jgi:hypothetical protein
MTLAGPTSMHFAHPQQMFGFPLGRHISNSATPNPNRGAQDFHWRQISPKYWLSFFTQWLPKLPVIHEPSAMTLQMFLLSLSPYISGLPKMGMFLTQVTPMRSMQR